MRSKLWLSPARRRSGGIRRRLRRERLRPSTARDRLAQLSAADGSGLARKGRARQLLDLHLHQLAAHVAVPARLEREVWRSGARRDRRAHAGVRVRERRRERSPSRAHDGDRRIRSRPTTSTPFGVRSATTPGRRCISSTCKAACATDTSAKVRTTALKLRSGKLLAEAGHEAAPAGPVFVDARGVEAAADWASLSSPETYLGYERATSFASRDIVARNARRTYTSSDTTRPQPLGAFRRLDDSAAGGRAPRASWADRAPL